MLKPRIHTGISTSRSHIVHKLNTTRELSLLEQKFAVSHAKSYVEDVGFGRDERNDGEDGWDGRPFRHQIRLGITYQKNMNCEN
jgi:2-isopropylmalate synthase